MNQRSGQLSVEESVSAPAVNAQASAEGLAWISWLRFGAMAAVVAIHVAGLTAVAPGARSSMQGEVATVLYSFSRWCVPVFVMVSGALLLDPARYPGDQEFLRKRALRLLPAIVVWHIVYTAFILLVEDHKLTLLQWMEYVLTGRLWTGIYFLWIVLGLAVITPVLVPWVASASQRAQVIAGLVAAAIPALIVITVPIRTDVLWKSDMSWVETPFTWWIPYVGFYLLGFALRRTVLVGWWLVAASAGAVGGSLVLCWQWRRAHGIPGLLERFVPAEAYYSPMLIMISVCVFLIGASLIRPGARLGALSRPGAAWVGRQLGDATLGVLVVHLLVLQAVLRMPFVGGGEAATSVLQLVVRYLAVFGGAYVISLVARRLPLLRRLC